MQTQRFCNIFREDDTVTRWVKEHVRDPLDNSPSLVQAVGIARWFNYIPTLEVLKEHSLFDKWDSRKAIEVLSPLRDRKVKIFTAAYLIASPKGLKKLEGICKYIDDFVAQAPGIQSQIEDQSPRSLEESWGLIREVRGIGDFMSYEIVTDLRHTGLLNQAHDIDTWANPGPGAARGASRVLDLPREQWIEQRHKERLNEVMLGLLSLSRDAKYWQPKWPPWEMRDAEHTLCEFDKYERCRLGEGKTRQKFKGGQQLSLT